MNVPSSEGREGLLGGRVGKRGGGDLVKGASGFVPNVGVGIRQAVGESGDRGEGLGANLPQGVGRKSPHCWAWDSEKRNQGGDRKLGSGLEFGKDKDCEDLRGVAVRRAEAGTDCGYYLLGSLLQVGDCGNRFESYDPRRAMTICNNRDQRGKSVSAEAGQSPRGRDGYVRLVGSVHETAQIVECRHCSRPEDGKSEVRSVSECWIDEQGRELVRKWGPSELTGKRASPWGWVELDPFQEERKGGCINAEDSVCCLFLVGQGGPGDEGSDPEAEWMSGVGGFSGRPPVYEDNEKRKSDADATEEKRSPFSHGDSVQRNEGLERAS